MFVLVLIIFFVLVLVPWVISNPPAVNYGLMATFSNHTLLQVRFLLIDVALKGKSKVLMRPFI